MYCLTLVIELPSKSCERSGAQGTQHSPDFLTPYYFSVQWAAAEGSATAEQSGSEAEYGT